MLTNPRRAVAVLLCLATVAVSLHLSAGSAGAYPGGPWFEPSKRYDENFPDPSILVDDGTNYAYGTATGGAYLPVMSSTDGLTWTARARYDQPDCVDDEVDPYFNDALPCPARWAPDRPVDGRLKKEVWAPGAARIGSRFVVFYTVLAQLSPERYCISVATSGSPLGPFVDDSTGPVVCDADPKGSIDPQPFVDTDGTPWLLWKSEGVPGSEPTRIWSRQLAPSGIAFADGSRASQILHTSQAWEGSVIENPAMIRHQGTLHLFYSANEWQSDRYAVGHATCTSVLGPCSKTADNPVLASRGDRLGPGGPAPFHEAGSGRLFLAYHWWNAPYTSYPPYPECEQDGTCTSQGQRRLGIAEVSASGDTVSVGGTPRPWPTIRSIDPACPDTIQRDVFSDTDGNVHARAIDCVAHWEITMGTGDGRYQPAALVTRGQMAAFIARTLASTGHALPSEPRQHFSDVAGTTHELSINQLAELEVVSGRADGTFGPMDAVDRGQMATFLARAVRERTGKELAITADWFADDDGSVHEAAVNRVASAGIAGGFSDGTYRPSRPVVRDQMASFIARTLALLVEGGYATVPR
ncbi:MAG TPA: family 43 glycosylhydrolase [Acidimicrobiales bacterium]|nr:family 43 glycosylhydrolase [Acidimicrobiales bacterium]